MPVPLMAGQVCFLVLCLITIALSEPQFSWNPGSSGLNKLGNTIHYDKDCGLSSAHDYWTLTNGFLTIDTDGWDNQVFITANEQICVIDLTNCGNPIERSEVCSCTGHTDRVFVLEIRRRARRANSESMLKATLNPAEGVTASPVVSEVGKLPLMYDPINIYLTVNSEPKLTLNPGRRFDVVSASNVTRLEFCAVNILPGSTLRAQAGSAVTEKQGGDCVTVVTKILGYIDYQLSFGYNEIAGCERYDVLKGVVRLKADVTQEEESTKFDNLETIYGVMLGTMAAIFLAVCVGAWYWYYKTKRIHKINREHELQGTLDFDHKYGSRMEVSQI